MIEFARYTEEEQEAAYKVVARAMALQCNRGRTVRDMMMDLSAVHAKTPLRLAELAKADDFNFAHDIGGIVGHLNRETGELEDCFVPRFASRAQRRALRPGQTGVVFEDPYTGLRPEGECRLVRWKGGEGRAERWEVEFRHVDGGWEDTTYERLIAPGVGGEFRGTAARRDDPDPDVRHGGKHAGDPWCDPAAR